jgi:hypothetical protein
LPWVDVTSLCLLEVLAERRQEGGGEEEEVW